MRLPKRTLKNLLLMSSMAAIQPALADSQNPSSITQIRAVGESGPAIAVSWNEPRDNVGVDGYNIYRNGNYYETVFGTTNYTDRDVISGFGYNYYVVAFDEARNYSRKGVEATAVAGDTGNSDPLPDDSSGGSSGSSSDAQEPLSNDMPSTPGNLRIDSTSNSSATFSWGTPAGGAEGFNIYIDGSYRETVRGTNSYTANSLTNGRRYGFSVAAFRNNLYSVTSPEVIAEIGSNSTVSPPPQDNPGNGSSNGSSDDVTEAQQQTLNTVPAPPGDLAIDNTSNSSATFSWSTPAGGADGFNIYIDGSYRETVRGTNSYTANSLTSGRRYGFSVAAFRNNLYSVTSAEITAEIGGNTTTSPPPQNDPDNSDNDSVSNNNRSGAVPDNYALVFSDEFNNGNIDSSKWNTSYRWGSELIINNEEQYYVDSLLNPDFGVTPFNLNNGTLTIQASRTPDWLRSSARGQQYLSGAMTTFNKFRMTYGYVEMRAKLPRGAGLWPAFWLLHQSDFQDRPEIDVVEMLGQNSRLVYQTYHYFNNNNLVSTPSFQVPGPDYANDFHTFGMLWEPGKITWYVDGVETNRFESNRVSKESMYILMNLAVGGGWPGSPNGSTPFPAKFEIDYVRAYQAR